MFALIAVLGFFGLLAQVVPDPSTAPTDFITFLSGLWDGAAWAPLIAAVVYGAGLLVQKYGGSVWPWVTTRVGKLVFTGLVATTLSVLQGLLGGLAVMNIVVNAVVALIGAVGLHSTVKNAKQGNR